MTSDQVLLVLAGLTQASSVIAERRSSEAESFIETRASSPLNDRAPPNLPAVVHVAFEILPVLPFPEASPIVAPAPSLKPYAATSPDRIVGGTRLNDDVLATLLKVAVTVTV